MLYPRSFSAKVSRQRWRSVEGLAAMPDLVSAHTNACVLMIGEKASDMIRGLPPLPAVANA